MKTHTKLWVVVGLMFSFMVTTVSAAALSDKTAPSCTLTELDGAPVHNLQELQGQVVYVDFWASWCPPCVRSFPFLNQLAHDLKDQGLRVVGVNLDENLADAEKFLVKYPADFSIVTDPGKQCAKDFNVIAMPSSYLIDRKGVIRHIHQGFRVGEVQALRHMIEQLLMEPL
ncbi:MAG: TlpA disulfide reductase family protein [Nitrosomonas sp.]|nr:TlpA disulfide reductase family protein [Nitrosomonas sp.]MDP1950275.1 TlpA disulfide reductase family protein [Nitrosomonas sp.]